MKAFIKANSTDRYLAPVRKQILSHIDSETRVLEFATGTGDFLLQAATKIKYGIGLDSNKSLVRYADRQRRAQKISNVSFRNVVVNPAFATEERFDWLIASLFFHLLPIKESLAVLQNINQWADNAIFCAFSQPPSRKDWFMLWLDQRFSSHYQKFKAYADYGYMIELLKSADLMSNCIIEPTFDNTIELFILRDLGKN